jgi:butyryl-CoA dehydrogenase
MNLTLTDDQLMMRDLVREFAREEIAPRAHDLDLAAQFPHDLVDRMKELGFFGMSVPEEYGGTGVDYISYILTIEELARACAALAIIVSVQNSVVCGPVLRFGTEEQKRRYLTALASEKLGAFCLTEPNAGSDAGAIQTTAVRKGDEYILNGSKVFVSNGPAADILIVNAKTNPALGNRGMSTFIVEKSCPGILVGTIERKMGIKASESSEIVFQDCHVPAENRLGEEGQGFKIAMTCLDGGRIGVGAQALGIAEAALDEAIRYSRERRQFGQRIGDFQAIQCILAEMARRVMAARLLVYRAAWLKQTGQPHTREASMAKLFASEGATEVTHKAVQVFGGYGYIKDYAVERYYRDARVTEMYEGTSEIQRMVIATQILAEAARPLKEPAPA